MFYTDSLLSKVLEILIMVAHHDVSHGRLISVRHNAYAGPGRATHFSQG